MPLRPLLASAKRRAELRVVTPLAIAFETAASLRARARIASFKRRPDVVRRFPAPAAPAARPRVVAVVTHVAGDARPQEEAADRLAHTLDGLLESLGHADLELVLETLPGRHVAAALPEHLRTRLVVREHEDADPLFLGFEAQEELVARAADRDWFLYLEDDIVLHDALLLEKLAFFNEAAPPEALLLPHRYEFWRGRKVYIDLVSKTSPEIGAWSRLTEIEVGDWRFAEFENPHSGFYALSRAQLERWIATGRRWRGRISHVASRESAATGCLGEAFRIYKPHPGCMGFLEVRHWDTFYAEQNARIHALEGVTGT